MVVLCLCRLRQDLGGPSTQEDAPDKKREEGDWEGGGGEEGEGGVTLEPLTEKQLNQVSLAEEVFGIRVVSFLKSGAYFRHHVSIVMMTPYQIQNLMP